MTQPIRLVLSDCDGTLVTGRKELAPGTVEAVGRLREADIAFAVTSSRPPRGLLMVIGPLGVTTPVGAFNGGVFVHPDLSVIEQHAIPSRAVRAAIDLIASRGLDMWVFRGSDWLVRDRGGPHVAHHARTVRFEPVVVPDFDDLLAGGGDPGVLKIVGVSDDHALVARVEAEAKERLGADASASRSSAYYLDVTSPLADKGRVVRYLSRTLGIPPQAIATIGDGSNDVFMFAESGLSIAMGNAEPDVQRAARHVTLSNDEGGWAHAVEAFVLP